MYFTKKRLMVVIWHLGIGGMQKRLVDVVKKISGRWEVVVVVKYRIRDSWVEKKLNKLGIRVIYLAEDKKKGNSGGTILKLISNYWQIRPEVVLTFLDHLSVLMAITKRLFWWRKTRLVLNESMVTSKYLDMQRGRWKYVWWLMVKWFYPIADRIVVTTEYGKRDLIRNFKIDESQIEVVPNWTEWKSSETKKKTIKILFVGRLEDEKGMDWLVQLARKYKIVTVGDGSWRKKLELNGARMVGYSDRVKDYMERAKILVLPTKNEGMPNVVLEAGKCGVVSVCRNFGGGTELIENGEDGFLVRTLEEMEKKIEELLRSENRRRKMAEKMKRKVEKYFGEETRNRFIAEVLG